MAYAASVLTPSVSRPALPAARQHATPDLLPACARVRGRAGPAAARDRPSGRCRSTGRPSPPARPSSAASRSAAGWRRCSPRTTRRGPGAAVLPPPSARRAGPLAHGRPTGRGSCPVLLLCGDRDPFARIALLRDAVGQLPRAELRRLPWHRSRPERPAARCPGSDRDFVHCLDEVSLRALSRDSEGVRVSVRLSYTPSRDAWRPPVRAAAWRTRRKFRLCGYCGAALAAAARAPAAKNARRSPSSSRPEGLDHLGEPIDPEASRGHDSVLRGHDARCSRAMVATDREVHRRRRSWRSSGFPSCTRTTRSAPSAPRTRCRSRWPTSMRSWRLASVWRSRPASASTPARSWPATPRPGSAWSPAIRSTLRPGSNRRPQRPRSCIGELTYRLVRARSRSSRSSRSSSRARREPVPAFRLLAVHGTDRRRRTAGRRPMVGREQEMGTPGGHLASRVDEPPAGRPRSRPTPASASRDWFGSSPAPWGATRDGLRGRCLPYGEGITFWPLAEVVRDAAGIDRRRAGRGTQKLPGAGRRPAIVDRLASAIGPSRRPSRCRSCSGRRAASWRCLPRSAGPRS